MAALASTQPQFIASTCDRNHPNTPLIDDSGANQIVVPDVSIAFLFFVFLLMSN